MTKLVAKQNARIALEWRKLEERASLIRGRVEAMPKAYQDGPMRAAENRIALRQMDKARELLDGIDAKLDEYVRAQEAAEMSAAGEEQARLLAERGVETFDDGIVKRRDGWQWLISRKPPRLTSSEIDAGNDYARLYSAALRDDLSVGSNDNGGGRGERDDPLDISITNRRRLETVQGHISDAVGSGRLVALLDAVCGRGETLRHLSGDDDRKAACLEVELRIALQMASVGIKMMRDREKKLAA